MKKLFLALAISISLLLLVGCEANLEELVMTEGTPATVTPRPTLVPMPPKTSTPTPTISPTPRPRPTYEPYPTPSTNPRDKDGSINLPDIASVSQCKGYLQYVDEKLGFTLDFPEYWKDYFIIYNGKQSLLFCFFGQSIVGQEYDGNPQTAEGIYLFTIVSEEVWNEYEDHLYCDYLGYVGEAKGIKYYAYESLDFPIGSLDFELNMIEMGESCYCNDEEEIARIKSDLEMALKISYDKRDILETFKAID